MKSHLVTHYVVFPKRTFLQQVTRKGSEDSMYLSAGSTGLNPKPIIKNPKPLQDDDFKTLFDIDQIRLS